MFFVSAFKCPLRNVLFTLKQRNLAKKTQKGFLFLGSLFVVDIVVLFIRLLWLLMFNFCLGVFGCCCFGGCDFLCVFCLFDETTRTFDFVVVLDSFLLYVVVVVVYLFAGVVSWICLF